MVVGEHDIPDVVLEVDHTTDVRRGKLLQYEAWGFPELWVEVPDWAASSRPPRAGSRIDESICWEKTATRSPRRAGRFRAGRRSRFT